MVKLNALSLARRMAWGMESKAFEKSKRMRNVTFLKSMAWQISLKTLLGERFGCCVRGESLLGEGAADYLPRGGLGVGCVPSAQAPLTALAVARCVVCQRAETWSLTSRTA